MTLAGRIALVTGASRGIGRAIARRLAAEGAALGVNFLRSRADAESLVSEIQSFGGTALALAADMADRAQVSAMVARLSAELGAVDILVNNAAVSYAADLDDYDADRLETMRRVNVDGLVHAIRAVAGPMRTRGFGRIVNIASIAAHGTSMRGTTFYAATKAEVLLLTRRFAMDLGPHGITVNAVAPGFIDTDMARQGRTREAAGELAAKISERAMVRRIGRPEDIAHAVAFLASPESGFITAQTLVVDGGRLDYIAHP